MNCTSVDNLIGIASGKLLKMGTKSFRLLGHELHGVSAWRQTLETAQIKRFMLIIGTKHCIPCPNAV